MTNSTRIKLISVVLGALILSGCDALFVEQPAADPEAIFDSLWRTFDESAANLEERNVDWYALYAQYRSMIGPGTSDAQLFGVLSDMLAHIDDSHVTLTAPDQRFFIANRIYRENIDRDLFDRDLVRDGYLGEGYRHGPSYLYGQIGGTDVAYIHFGTIDRQTMARLPQMLDAYPRAAGYIVDLRQNVGGNHTFAFDAMARLTDQPRYVFRSKTKNGPGRGDYTEWHEWHLQPSGRYVDRPIVVLTDRYTPSAAERMVMAFKTLPNATIMGDTTSGTHGTKIPRELANGWYFTLSVQKVEMFDGKSYEGLGLAPDLTLKNDRDELRAGTDRVLEAAIGRLTAGT